jgi:hypothetical protein
MEFQSWIAEHFVNGVGSDMPNIINIRVTRSLNANSNSAEITIDNYAGRSVSSGEVIYRPDQTVKIYATNGIVDKTNADHLLGTYIILNHEIDVETGFIKLTLGDKTYNMLSKIHVIKNVTDTIDGHVENIVQTINNDGSTATTITTNIASTRSDSSAFPSYRYTSVWKNAYEMVEELSQTDLTGDNLAYMFWFDENDEFHWMYPGTTALATTISRTDDFVINMTVRKTESESIAMIIYNAGNDLDDNARVFFHVDPTAGTIKNRVKYQPMTDIEKLLKQQYATEIAAKTITNTEFVKEMDLLAIARCNNIFLKVGTGLWQVTANTYGGRYTIGGLYPTSAPEQGFATTNLRLKTIVHRMNKNGWRTILTLEEDPTELDNI